MSFTIKENLYMDESGKPTYEQKAGRQLLLVAGAVISDKQADEMNLRDLGRALDKAAVQAAVEVGDPVAVMKAAQQKAQAGQQQEGATEEAKVPPVGEAESTPAQNKLEASVDGTGSLVPAPGGSESAKAVETAADEDAGQSTPGEAQNVDEPAVESRRRARS